MIVACLVLLVLLVLLALVGGWWRLRSSPADRLLRQHLLDRYVVTVEAGETFTGLLDQVDDRTLVLRDVTVLMKDGSSRPVDGEVVLRREAVAYMQRPSSVPAP